MGQSPRKSPAASSVNSQWITFVFDGYLGLYWCFNCPNFRRIAKVANSQLKNANESSELNFYQIIRIGADLQFVQQMQLQSFFLSIFFPSYFLRCIILQEEEVSHRKKMCAKFNFGLNANLLTFPRTQLARKCKRSTIYANIDKVKIFHLAWQQLNLKRKPK